MFVTVAICTWNRAKLLDQTLAEMRKLVIAPSLEWEILVVNNNCTDETDQAIARHAESLPIRRLFESQPGQCYARNRACDAARGDLIIWTDDDVLVPQNWIADYVAAAQKFPEAGILGGPIVPVFETEPPRWVRENLDLLGGPYAALNMGDFTGPFTPGLTPYGANMAFRREAFGTRRFDTRIGYTAGSFVGGDESALIHGMLQDGITGIWVGTAGVRHFISPSRMTAEFLWKYHEGAGRSYSILGKMPKGPRIMGCSVKALCRFLYHRLAALCWAGIDTRRWMAHYSASATAYGALCIL